MATKDYYKGVTIQYKGDATQLSKVLGQLNAELRQSQAASRALDAALKLDPKSLGLIKDRSIEVARQLNTTKERVAALKQALETTEDPAVIQRLITESDKAEARLKSLQEQLVKLNVKQSMASGEGLGGLAQTLQDAGTTLQTLGDAATRTGDKLTMGLTAPIVAFSAASVGAAMTVDTALTDVKKTVDGTAEQYANLKEAAIEYSKTNGVTAEQVLQAQSLGAQLGYAVDELEMLGRVSTGLDLSTNMSLEQATTEMAQFANITKMGHEYTENYASTIVALGNTTATTESKISGMAQEIAAAGSQVGMTNAEILGLSAAISSSGVEAEKGGTAISTVISRIDKDVATNSEDLQTWAQTAGMSAQQFAQAWRTSPAEALTALLTHMGDVADAGGNMSLILEDLGIKNVRQIDVFKRLAGNSELLTKSIATANQAWEENTALTEEVANRNDSLAAKMQMLQNRVTAIMEKVGKPIADALISTLDAAQPLFDAVESGAKAFENMTDAEQRGVITTIALAASIGPVLSVLGRLSSGAGNLAKVLENAAESLLTYRECLNEGYTATEALEYVSGDLGSVIKSGLVSVGITLAIATIAELISMYIAWKEHTELVQKATEGLTQAAQQSSETISVAASEASGSMARSVEEVKKATEDALQSAADFSDKINDAMGDLGTNQALAESYAQTMEELGNKGEITADDLARLKNAVDEYNTITGAAVEITNDQTGALNLSKSAIDEVTESYRRQAEQQAYAELYKDAIKQQAENERELAQVTRELAECEQATRDAMGAAGDGALVVGPKLQALRDAQQELSDTSQALASNVTYWGDQIADTSTKFTTVETAMVAAGVTGAQYDQLTQQQLAEIRAAFDGTIKSIASTLAKFGISVGGAGDVAVSQASKAANSVVDIATDGAEQATSAQNAAANKAIQEQQRAFSKEEAALRKQNTKIQNAMRKAHQAEQKELRKELDARLKQRQKELDAEIKAEEKANQKRLKDLKSEQEAATKTFREETDKRIAEIEREYNAQLKQVENDGTSEIDAKIKALQDEGKAEEDAAARRKEQEEVAELEKAVRQAKSNRSRLEAQKALDDKLDELAREKRDREREQEIERLRDQKEAIAEQTQEAKDALKEQYDAEKEEYEKQRSEELERKQAAFDEDYEKLQEQLSQALEAHRENNTAILDDMRESNQARFDAMSEAHSAEEEALQESLDAQLEAMRDAHQAALDEMREAASGASGIAKQATDDVETIFEQFFRESKTDFSTAKENLRRNLESAGETAKTNTKSAVESMLSELGLLREDMPEIADEAGAEFVSSMEDAGEDATDSLTRGLENGYADVEFAASQLGQAQESADRSGDAEDWGIDLGNNLSAGIWRAYDSVMDSVEALAEGIKDIMGHSIAKEGPLSVGGRGESVWGSDLVQNFIHGMESEEDALRTQSERLARIVESAFSPNVAARYDANLNIARSYDAAQLSAMALGLMQSGAGGLAGVGDINITMNLEGFSLDSTTDIRAASRALGAYTVKEIMAKLGK